MFQEEKCTNYVFSEMIDEFMTNWPRINNEKFIFQVIEKCLHNGRNYSNKIFTKENMYEILNRY